MAENEEECEEDGGGSETVKTVVDEGVDWGMGEFNKLIRKPDFLIFQVVLQVRFSWTLPPMRSAV